LNKTHNNNRAKESNESVKKERPSLDKEGRD